MALLKAWEKRLAVFLGLFVGAIASLVALPNSLGVLLFILLLILSAWVPWKVGRVRPRRNGQRRRAHAR